jgi:hypothetical protein
LEAREFARGFEGVDAAFGEPIDQGALDLFREDLAPCFFRTLGRKLDFEFEVCASAGEVSSVEFYFDSLRPVRGVEPQGPCGSLIVETTKSLERLRRETFEAS